jgi:hypothetical protein
MASINLRTARVPSPPLADQPMGLLGLAPWSETFRSYGRDYGLILPTALGLQLREWGCHRHTATKRIPLEWLPTLLSPTGASPACPWSLDGSAFQFELPAQRLLFST